MVDRLSCTAEPAGTVASTYKPFDYCTTRPTNASAARPDSAAANTSGTGSGAAGSSSNSNSSSLAGTAGGSALGAAASAQGPIGSAGSGSGSRAAGVRRSGAAAAVGQGLSNTSLTLAGCRCLPRWNYTDPASGIRGVYEDGACHVPDQDPAGPCEPTWLQLYSMHSSYERRWASHDTPW